MFLETDRLIIRDLMLEDEAPFVEMASDGSLSDIGFDRDCSGWMKSWIKESKELANEDNPAADYLAYTIVLKETGTVIGSIGCSYYDDFQETGITYFIGAKYRDNGYAAEAAKIYIEYFFNHYNIPELIATVREENVSSWRVVEKTGFEFVEKKRYRDINDENEEMYRFYKMKRWGK